MLRNAWNFTAVIKPATNYNANEVKYWPVEPLEHDGILSAEVISWKRVGLPAEPLISVGQILSSGNISTELRKNISQVELGFGHHIKGHAMLIL